jgi:hypothetical protein
MTVSYSLHSSLDYERLLFHCDWLGSDLRIGHFFSFRCPLINTPQMNTELSYDWTRSPLWLNHWTLLNWTELNWTLEWQLPYDCIVLLCMAPYIGYR